MMCPNCQRAMRPRKTSIQDHPGTVQETARGLCATCYNRTLRNYGKTRKPSKVADAEIADSPCVLTRVYLTPATYKALRLRGVKDIGAALAQIADKIAAEEVSDAA